MSYTFVVHFSLSHLFELLEFKIAKKQTYT